jgi:hypothetical protein
MQKRITFKRLSFWESQEKLQSWYSRAGPLFTRYMVWIDSQRIWTFPISKYLRDFGYETVVSEKKMKSGILLTFQIDGFLYQGTPKSKSRVQMDVSRGDVRLGTDLPQFFSLYPDIASFRIKVMTPEEIMAEKIRALLTRKKARDAYDIWFLLRKGVRIDRILTQEKLNLYGIKLGRDPVKEALDECKRIWKKELKSMMVEVPDFKIIESEIRNAMKDF